ncbi:restriction endonuclease subunit S [Psychrobacter sp. P11G3]|nr:restriction endonuclease subunit S [Psychrobacter sp. P11G3]
MSKDISKPEQLITEHIDIWTSAILPKSTSGRGSSKKYELYGISKLRELILELAVRGKLVPQDANDESASILLEKIAVEKAQLIKDKKIKKPRTLPKFIKEDEPFELPLGWEWCLLLDIGHDWGQKNPDTDFTYIDVGSIDKKLGLIENADVLNADNAPSRARKIVKKGTVIYSTIRPYLLNIAVVNREFEPEPIASTAFSIIHPLDGISSSFVYRYLRSPSFVSYVESCQTGIAYPAINDKQFFSGLIPIPPTNEQHRIVAKVDELMMLCDQLEQQTEASIDAHATLVEVLLATLTDSTDSDELAQNWARISEHFDSLFTTEQSIEALKQTVLQLAVMGKLVPQNPEDEPASVLLEKIAEEKEQLIQDKKIKPRKALPPIENEEKLFDLPLGWEWCRLDDICDGITSGSTPPKNSFIDETGIPYLKVYNIRNQKIDFEYQPQFIEESYHSSSLKRSQLCPGDVIMNIVGPPLGKIAIIPDTYPQWNCNQAIVMFRPFISDLNKFIYTYLVSGMFLDKIALIGTAGQDNISVTKSRAILLPTPPLAEQLRIVAKIDELMAICDQLKEKIRQSQETQVQLTDALVDQALG